MHAARIGAVHRVTGSTPPWWVVFGVATRASVVRVVVVEALIEVAGGGVD